MKPEHFGSLVRDLRRQRSLPLKEIAVATGVSISYLSRLERGERRPPSPEVVVRMAKILGSDPLTLLTAAGYLEATTLREVGLPYGLDREEWQTALSTLSPEDWEDVQVLIRAKLARYRNS